MMGWRAVSGETWSSKLRCTTSQRAGVGGRELCLGTKDISTMAGSCVVVMITARYRSSVNGIMFMAKERRGRGELWPEVSPPHRQKPLCGRDKTSKLFLVFFSSSSSSSLTSSSCALSNAQDPIAVSCWLSCASQCIAGFCFLFLFAPQQLLTCSLVPS